MELFVSIAVLTAVIMIADVSLALQGNWPRILRLTLSAAVYVGVLGATLKVLGRFGAPARQLPVGAFLGAGAAAGLVGALARPELSAPLVAVSAVLTPALLGTFHWVVLQRWAWIRDRIISRRSSRARP